MSQSIPKQTRQIVLALVLIAAIFMIAVEPFLVDAMLDVIQPAQVARFEKFTAEGNPQAPLVEPAAYLTGFFYPFWMSLAMFAGLVLLLIAKPLYNGAKWARALTLVCLSMPAIGGAYMLVPYLNFVGEGIPPALIIMAFGLIPYFTVVLVEKNDLMQKVLDFYIFLMLGVTAAETFANGHAAHRVLAGHPAIPIYAEGIFILTPARNVAWIAAIVLIAAIYFMSLRKEIGWYLAMAGGLAAMVTGFSTQYVRTATYDYLYQGLMGLGIVVILLIPVVKERMVTDHIVE